MIKGKEYNPQTDDPDESEDDDENDLDESIEASRTQMKKNKSTTR